MIPRQQKAAGQTAANRKGAFESKQPNHTIIAFPIHRRWPGPRQKEDLIGEVRHDG